MGSQMTGVRRGVMIFRFSLSPMRQTSRRWSGLLGPPRWPGAQKRPARKGLKKPVRSTGQVGNRWKIGGGLEDAHTWTNTGRGGGQRLEYISTSKKGRN